MFAENLTKQAYNGEWLQQGRQAVNYYNPAYQSSYSNQAQQPPGQAPIGMAGLLSALMMAPPRTVKKQDNLFDYAMHQKEVTPDLVASQFESKNPEYYAQIQRTRDALNDAGGYGLINTKGTYSGSLDTKQLVDAFMLEKRMDKKLYMLEALKAQGSPQAKKAVKAVMETGMIDPSLKEKFWKIEHGSQSIAANILRAQKANSSSIPGSKDFTGGNPAARWFGNQFNRGMDTTYRGLERYTDWMNGSNNKTTHPSASAPVTAPNHYENNALKPKGDGFFSKMYKGLMPTQEQ